MAKVKVNKKTCINCGTCYSVMQDHFDLGDDGKAEVKKGISFTEEEAEEAISICPTGSIQKDK